jgi:hypothetical protein
MILLNFAHPLTREQIAQIEDLSCQKIASVIEIPSQIDSEQPLAPQVVAMADAAGLTPQQWQTESILINLPSLNYSAVLLIAELHGRMGYFPPCVRLRPVKDALPPRFEVAEVLNLQAVRDGARRKRR